MGVFSNIMGKIFGHKPKAAPAPAPAAPAPAPTQAEAAPAAVAVAPAPPPQVIDVTAALDDMAASAGQKLDWRHSIVDLMKLVGMESSLAERKELADELGYTGDKSDSATMNIWLHKQVMKKLEENGGKVPADLKD
jgi:3-oxoacyl-ACP reductase-like protein